MSDLTQDLTPLRKLELLSSSVVASRRDLEANKRGMNGAQVAEKLDILQQARDEARKLREACGDLVGEERNHADTLLSHVEESWQSAREIHQRKVAWEENIEPHIQAIKDAGRHASELHRDLRNHRREFTAGVVAEMKTRLEEWHRDAVESQARLMEVNLPHSVKSLVERNVEIIQRALQDAGESFGRKHQWEAGISANATALEQMVKDIEAAVAGGADPGAVTTMVKKFSRELERRRPLDGGLRQNFESRVHAVAADARAVMEAERRERSQKMAEVRDSIPRILDELDRLLPPLPPRGPQQGEAPPPGDEGVISPADEREHVSQEEEETQAEEMVAQAMGGEGEEHEADAGADTPPLSKADMERVLILEAELRTWLNSPLLSGPERRRYFHIARTLGRRIARARRLASIEEERDLMARVQQVVSRAQGGGVRGILKEIQALQKDVNGASLPRRRKETIHEQLRAAWNSAVGRIEAMEHQRHDRDQQRIRELGTHMERWERRIDGLSGLIHRLEQDLIESDRRAKSSTSIGYRVVAEKFRQQTNERIEELKATLEDLQHKVEDVRPRLVAAGWPWPEEATPQADDIPGPGENRPRR